MLTRRFLLGITGLVYSAIAAAWSAHAAPSPPTDVALVERTETSARISWRPGPGSIRGFKIRPSSTPGAHVDPATYPGGRLAAFTFTTDDGYDDNLLYEPSFSSRGLHFTAFIIPVQIGVPGYLTWADVRSLHAQGHEIASHTMHHLSLIDDRAIALRYVGAEPCSLAIVNRRLRTWVAGAADLDISLTAPDVYFLATLASFLDADPDYEAVRLAAPDTIYATYSQFLDPVAGRQIGAGAPAETLTTARGVHDDVEMRAEILDSRAALESAVQLADPVYRCRTLAYPNHAHTQWTMSTLNELGILGARAGNPGSLPYCSQGAFRMGFTTTYEVPLSSPYPSNAWTEAQTRSAFANRIPTWKANRDWAVLMTHNEAGIDAQHIEWAIDTIASDPEVWIARFDEVMEYLSSFAIDVGYPYDPVAGSCSAWIQGLDPSKTYWVVVTAYDANLSESTWSGELEIPAVGTAVPRPDRATSNLPPPRAVPNPFARETSIEFSGGPAGSTRVSIYDVAGRLVKDAELGTLGAGPHRFTWDGRDDDRHPVGSGVYWFRIRNDESTQTGSVHVVR